MADEDPEPSVVEAFCGTCRRTAYVRSGAEMACPVCSSPLVAVGPGTESQAS